MSDHVTVAKGLLRDAMDALVSEQAETQADLDELEDEDNSENADRVQDLKDKVDNLEDTIQSLGDLINTF
jgi:hypothetical protein